MVKFGFILQEHNMKSVLIRISTQEIIKKGNYPNIDIVPIDSLESDLEWLIVNELDKPVFDPSIERLQRLEEITIDAHPIYTELNQYRISYPVISLTQEQQYDYIQQQEDNDSSAQQFQQYKNDGIQGFDRAYALIIRRKNLPTGHANKITATQAKNISEGLYEALEPLYKGLWQLVKLNLSNETPPTNAKLLDVFNKIKTGVDNYVSNNY